MTYIMNEGQPQGYLKSLWTENLFFLLVLISAKPGWI